MSDYLFKLRPDRDLQCYFERPSAIAALSECAPDRFKVSGSWRQPFDWAVVEWNRDNTFEHPSLRNLPDGDLSTLRLSYEESRSGCITIDSDLYPTVDWNYLRIWATANDGIERAYKVPLYSRATAVEGQYTSASAAFTITGTIRAGDYIGLAFLGEHHTRQVFFDDSLSDLARDIAADINAHSALMSAEQDGATIRVFYTGGKADGSKADRSNATTGVNGNRVGAYGHVTPGSTLAWQTPFATLSGGVSPTRWRVDIDFSSLQANDGSIVPTNRVRKMRWTYAAEYTNAEFSRREFAVAVSNWTVAGAGRLYSIAGPGSRRIEDSEQSFTFTGNWTAYGPGNFSGGTIRYTTTPGAVASVTYQAPQAHTVYLGTRLAFNGTNVNVNVDGQPVTPFNTLIAGEDALARVRLANLGPGTHTIRITHQGAAGEYLYIDFLDIAVPSQDLPEQDRLDKVTLATDWDTDHSIAIAPERSAWLIKQLGFHGRANHYVGAMWFYELVRAGHQYASTTVGFAGSPVMSQTTRLIIGQAGAEPAIIDHLNLAGDTAGTITQAFAQQINNGFTGIRAEVENDSTLRLYARQMGVAGNQLQVTASPASGDFAATVASSAFLGGVDGNWITDTSATPRVNRAARDWAESFYRKLDEYGIGCVAAFSMELQHGDTSEAAGLAQRYPSGAPVLLNTPALQTNFSPISLNFWRQVYLDMALTMKNAGIEPFLQFGEVQWWYFPDTSGMTFYDAYTRDTFQQRYGRPMSIITGTQVPIENYRDELLFAASLVGEFTNAVISFVRAVVPECKFEVLFPPDVNEPVLTQMANYPASAWRPELIDILKTENFTYTFTRDLNASHRSMLFGERYGFSPGKRSHLVGLGDPTAPWEKEANLALAEGAESVVLFALDQWCLIGYPALFKSMQGHSAIMK